MGPSKWDQLFSFLRTIIVHLEAQNQFITDTWAIQRREELSKEKHQGHWAVDGAAGDEPSLEEVIIGKGWVSADLYNDLRQAYDALVEEQEQWGKKSGKQQLEHNRQRIHLEEVRKKLTDARIERDQLLKDKEYLEAQIADGDAQYERGFNAGKASVISSVSWAMGEER